jgi:hypothetical protein
MGLNEGVVVHLHVKLWPDATASMGQLAGIRSAGNWPAGSVSVIVTVASLAFLGAGFVTVTFPESVKGASLPTGKLRVTCTVYVTSSVVGKVRSSS